MIAALLALAALQTEPPAPDPPASFAVRAVPFPGLDAPKAVGCLALRAGLTLETDRSGFGGYSDLVLDGLSGGSGEATLISDAGHVLWLDLETDASGDLTGVSNARLARMIERDGSRLGKRDGDAEGLVRMGGGYIVSFETLHRVARMNASGVLGATMQPPTEDREAFGSNSGFEALAALPDGTLLAISEGKDGAGDAVVRRGRMDQPLEEWVRHSYRPADDFAVTGAATDPQTGDLFVLERAYSPWRGARMRIVRVAMDDIDESVIRGRELTRMGFLEGIDNMEGIAAARMADGTLRLHLVSDDNFSALQRTVLLTLGLAPGCEDGDAAEAAARGDAAAQGAVEEKERP